jgi:hypothetical protein
VDGARIRLPVRVEVGAVRVRAREAVEVRDAAAGHDDTEPDSKKAHPQHAATLHDGACTCRLR